MPMLVGEWGAYYENPAAVGAAQFAVRQFDLAGCGDLYWDYRGKCTSRRSYALLSGTLASRRANHAAPCAVNPPWQAVPPTLGGPAPRSSTKMVYDVHGVKGPESRVVHHRSELNTIAGFFRRIS